MKQFFLLALLFSALSVSAQTAKTDTTKKDTGALASLKDTSYWKATAVTSLSFSQVSLTNWSAGGQNSVAMQALMSTTASYKKDRISWDNTLDLAYGLLQQGGREAKLQKSDDKIDFSSKLGIDMRKKSKWFYSGLIGFKSQFTAGYAYSTSATIPDIKISDFLAPGYVIAALGMDYRPTDYFTVLISPLTGRVTIVNDQNLADAGAFGVEKAVLDTSGAVITHGKKHREEFGGYIKASFKKDIMKNVNLTTKLELFSNYLSHPENVDVNWETLIAMKVNKFISASISTQLIYDNDTNIAIDKNNDGVIDVNGPRVQFKEVLGIGLSYKF